jgi:phosphatidylglycerophosphate synthase
VSVHYRARDLLKVPGALSLLRLPLAAVFPFVIDRPEVALGVLFASAASDVLDGFLARRLHQETPIGAVVDGLTDKVFVLSVGLTLFATHRLSLVALLALGVRDGGEMLALLAWRLRHRRAPDEEQRANVLGKVTTLLQFFAVVAAILTVRGHLELSIASALTGAAAAYSYHRRLARLPVET